MRYRINNCFFQSILSSLRIRLMVFTHSQKKTIIHSIWMFWVFEISFRQREFFIRTWKSLCFLSGIFYKYLYSFLLLLMEIIWLFMEDQLDFSYCHYSLTNSSVQQIEFRENYAVISLALLYACLQFSRKKIKRSSVSILG